jgi:hypothetical protein
MLPVYCDWPWLGRAFNWPSGNSLACETDIVHVRGGDALLESPTCEFRAVPFAIAETGVCPVCGGNERTPLNDPDALLSCAKGVYRQIIMAYSDYAMRYYVVCDWSKVKRGNRGRKHTDHIYPVALGFENGVPETMVGSPVNCQLLSASENARKHTKPGQTLPELRSRYEEFVAADPYWGQLEEALARTGTLSGVIPKILAKRSGPSTARTSAQRRGRKQDTRS